MVHVRGRAIRSGAIGGQRNLGTSPLPVQIRAAPMRSVFAHGSAREGQHARIGRNDQIPWQATRSTSGLPRARSRYVPIR